MRSFGFEFLLKALTNKINASVALVYGTATCVNVMLRMQTHDGLARNSVAYVPVGPEGVSESHTKQLFCLTEYSAYTVVASTVSLGIDGQCPDS